MAEIGGGLIHSKSQSDSISYSRTETTSTTVTKTNNVKLGGGNITNVYLGTNQVKAIYLGDKLIIGTQTTYSERSVKRTLSIKIYNDGSLFTEAKYDAYSYIVENWHMIDRDDPVETTINTYIHNAYSYIRYLINHTYVATPTFAILPTYPSYSVSKGFAVKRTLGHATGECELMVYNSPVTPNANLNGPIPFAQFSVYTDYQKINCNVWRSNWYNPQVTEPPTDTPQNSTATITLTTSINGSELKCVGVTLVLRPGNTNKTISLGVNANGIITGNTTVAFDNLTNGTTNTIQISNFKFATSVGTIFPSGYGNLIANVDGINRTLSSGPISSLSGSLSLDCPENGKTFMINIRIQQTS